MRASRHRQDGASAVIVAISLFLLFGAGAIAIDLGSAWQTKRSLVVDTDSGAVAAARVAAEEGCTGTAQQAALDFLSANLGETVNIGDITYACDAIEDFTTPNTVLVELTDEAQQTLSSALGSDAIEVFAASTAEFNGGAFGGLRPISVCSSLGPIQSAMTTDPPDEGLPMLVSMERTWKDPTSCGGAAGFWSWMCFASNCGQSSVNQWLASGYTGTIDLGSADDDKRDWDDPARDEDCNPPPPRQDTCETKQGGVGNISTSTEGQLLIDLLRQTFSILITDQIYPSCGGGPCVHPWGFAYVGLEAVCQRGNNVNKTDVFGDLGAMTQADCFAAGVSNGDIVFAFRLFGISLGGEPEDYYNPQPAKVELCGADNDPGIEPNRCDRVFSS